MISAVIFDMDGLLIDSEPLWHRAEKAVFESVGVVLSRAQQYETTGLRTIEVVQYRYRQQPWEGKPQEQIAREIIEQVLILMRKEGKMMPGVHKVLDFFQGLGLPIALASSSSMQVIETAVEIMGIRDYFQLMCSAEFEALGKPNPAIYLTTAAKLEIEPSQCLAFEDSFNGLLAAKSAQMKAVSIPESIFLEDPRFGFADVKLASLEEFSPTHFKQLGGEL